MTACGLAMCSLTIANSLWLDDTGFARITDMLKQAT